MKQAITGYITALINNYERKITNLYATNVNLCKIRKYEKLKDELCDLLDFVIDIQEEKKEPTKVVLNNNTEILSLKKYIKGLEEERSILLKNIKELEESCQYMCDIEKNQLEKMELLKAENEDLKAKLLKKGEN
ncbi:TPA: hypothetical protein PTV51_002218 [Clostridium botulinum]|nr:hypothetical protein [Clostridium botulinum]HDK7201488.1 hypothetical protein [Clostridium botulinum]